MEIQQQTSSSIPETNQRLQTLIEFFKGFYKFLWKKKIWIITFSLTLGIIGALYNYYKKPTYTAELLFAIDDEGGDASSYSNIAAQFGISLGGGGGGAFKGDNLLEIFKSRYILEKTLMDSSIVCDKNDLFINHLIQLNYKQFASNKFRKGVKNSYYQDSIISIVVKDIVDDKLNISRIDKRLTFVTVSFRSFEQEFSKYFVEKLLDNVIDFYTETKTKKAKQNVAVMTHELDSIGALMGGAMMQAATNGDLNINTVMQIAKVPITRSNANAQIYTIAYGEIMKNLELAKLSLMKQTPLVQTIDRPVLPLKKEKKGRLSGLLSWGFVGLFFMIVFYYFKYSVHHRKNYLMPQT